MLTMYKSDVFYSLLPNIKFACVLLVLLVRGSMLILLVARETNF